ncbi:MAG TPA: T9SS type A sorting domain-containing protein, partial [Bacteroidales bacterium]|nr:T9SS type A sorting domain-containing protein [Bacteroidales bacterium]
PLIYCQEDKTFIHDVSNNCWGDNFVPQEDLVPLKSFTFFPPWDCEFGEALDDPSAPMIAYETAINEVEDADYTGAEAQLQSIVSTWPESSFASTAMKMMPAIAVQLNNLNQLINYYNTNSNIQQDEELKKLAGYLTADCRVYMENYQAALSFYEDIIADPPTPEDSIYAVIDAGKVSYMMEENGKAASASFKYQEMIPKTFELYTRNRKKLLDEIGGMPNDAEEIVQQPDETNSDLPTGEVRIYPNPVQNTLNITCNLNQAGTVAVKIYNSAGKLIRALHHEMSNSVQYQETVNMEDLPDGIYFIKIDQNHTTLHTQSIVVN